MSKKYLAQIIATDSEGLRMISACTAGAKVKVANIKYLASNKVFLLSIERIKIETNQEDKKINPVKFIDTFIFQFLNPKGVMAAITLISKFVIEDDYLNSSLTVIVVCSLTALTSITTWAFFGKFLRNFATNNNFIKRFNYAMSMLLIVCIIGFYI